MFDQKQISCLLTKKMENNLIAALFTTLKNANHSKHNCVRVKLTRKTCFLLKMLAKEGYIIGFRKLSADIGQVFLKYTGFWLKEPKILAIQLISRPSKKVYSRYKNLYSLIATLYKGNGFALINTSSGVLNHVKAYTYKKGGEVLAFVT
jgi:small subunit ribosomal protein S8